MQLFPDQEAVVDRLYDAIEAGEERILLRAPTGAGKTVIASHVMKDIYDAGGRCLFLCHLDQLVIQTAEKLIAYGVPKDSIGFITGGRKPDYLRPMQIGSVQTLARRKGILTDFSWTAVILDECHISAFANSVQSLFPPLDAE